MLTTNTMRYGTDKFSFDYSGKIQPNQPWDFTDAAVSSVDGFTITGTQPAGTDRRAVFKVDGSCYKLTVADGVGTPSAVASEDIDTILADGNTMAELSTVTSIPAWVGKAVYPIFALYAGSDVSESDFPTLKVDVSYTSNADQYVRTETSQEIDLPSDSVIVSATADSTTSDGNTVEVTASLYKNGAWGEYTALENILNETASKVRFKAVFTVQAIGVGSCELHSVRIGSRSGSSKTSATDSVIITNTQNLGMAAKYIRASVVHDGLKDAEITGSVSFRGEPLTRELYNLGTATGGLQTFSLPDADIIPNTIQILAGSSRVYSFDYNTETKTITLTASAGKEVFVSYQYGAGQEEWLPMLSVGTQIYERDATKYNTTFSYGVPDSEAGKETAAVQFMMRQLPGTATEPLGTATGKQQKFVLKHNAKAETLSIPGASFDYDEDTNIVTLVAAQGTELAATYDYNGKPPVAYSYVVAWND